MGAPDRRRPTIATEAEVLALATSTGAVLLRAFAAAAARCAATGCTICARADDLYTRALAVRAGRTSAVDGRRSVVAHDADHFRPAPPAPNPPPPQQLGRIDGRAAAKPRAALSSVRTKYKYKNKEFPPRTPPTPVGGGADRRRWVRPPTRAERQRALLTRERYRAITPDHNPCRHEPTCDTEEACIGRLVEYARAELETGQAQERAARRHAEPQRIAEPAPQLLDDSFRRRPKERP